MNLEAYGRVESRKMRKFVLRAASRPNQIEFSHSLGHLQPSCAVPTDGSLSPGRRGRYHPRPPQTRTCAIHAFGSSRESFADDVMDAFGAILCHRHSLTEGIYLVSFSYPCRIVDKVCRVHVPSLVSRHGPLLATPPFPPSGPSEPGSPLSQVL